MNDDFLQGASGAEAPRRPRGEHTLGSSTIYNLCEEVIQLREKNDRQHKMFDQTLTKVRDALQGQLQRLRRRHAAGLSAAAQEIQGEKKFSLALLTLLLEIHQELEHIMKNQPADLANAEAMQGLDRQRGRAIAQGEGCPAAAGHPRIRCRPRLALQSGPARAGRQHAQGRHGAAAGGRATRARLRQPAAGVQAGAGQGDCLRVGRLPAPCEGAR